MKDKRGLSFELRDGVVVSSESSVDNVRSHVHHVWHDRLALRTIPRNVSWLSVPVSVGCLMVLMEDRGLSGSPLSVSIWERWVLWKNLSNGPVKEVWIVNQGLCVEGMVI